MSSKRKSDNNEKEDNKKFKNDEINDFITCNVCREIILPPIMQCIKGHLICNMCRVKCKNCPQCRAKLDNSRNFVFEKIVSDMKFECKHDKCNELVEYQKLKEHHDTCKFKPFQCFKHKCDYEHIKYENIIKHLKEDHKLKYFKLDKPNISLDYFENNNEDNEEYIYETLEFSVDNPNSLLNMIDFPNMATRNVRRNQIKHIIWRQVILEYKSRIYLLFFEKKDIYKIYLADMNLDNKNQIVKISLKKNENKLENTMKINSKIEFESKFEFLTDKCDTFSISKDIMNKYMDNEKIKINIDFL